MKYYPGTGGGEREEGRDGGGGSPKLVNNTGQHNELRAGRRQPKFAIDLDTSAGAGPLLSNLEV